MSQGVEENKLPISDFKNQVSQMIKALSNFDSFDRSEAFGYLKNCVKNLEPSKEDAIVLEKNENETNQIFESCSKGSEVSFKTSTSKHCFNMANYDSSINTSNKDDESESKCSSCGMNFSSLKELYFHGVNDHPGHSISCQNCRKTFSSSQIYQIHFGLPNCCMPKNKHPSTLLCPYCDKKYQNFQHYSLHIEGHKRNLCEDCGVHFNSRKILKEHTLNEHNKKLLKDLFECKFCDRKYAQKRSLLKHYRLIHNKDNIICLTCGNVFEKESELKIHEKTHANSTFLCNSCGETFSRRQQYIIHIKEHDKYQCLTCKTSCPNKMKLEKHERAGHVIKGLPTEHQCLTCGSSFHFQSSLFFHKKLHSASNEEHYGCEPCKRIFKNYKTYREHLLIEQHMSSVNSDGVSNVVLCEYCNKVFSHKRTLLKHMNKYHVKGKKIFQCDICDFKSHTEACFYKHQKLHTKKKEFICEKCGDSFYTKNALVGHFNYVHNEERNFSCEKCGQTFKSSSVLNRHMLCHNKERTHKCHCGQSFKIAGNLNRHRSVVHGIKTKSKRVKRLITDEVAILTSKNTTSRKKQAMKEKQQINNTTIYALIDAQAAVSLPLEQIISQSNLLLSGNPAETQMLHTACHNLEFSVENRTQLVLSQNLDMAALREVDTLLQSEDSLKTTDTNEAVDSGAQNIFGRDISVTDSSASFLDGESLIHPPIEPSYVTILDDSSLNSVDRLETDPDHSNSQTHIPGLSEENYYSIHFLDI